MEDTLKLSLIQTDNVWEDIQANLEHLSQSIDQMKESTDVLLLPELFSTGFTMKADRVAESMQGKGVRWMKNMADTRNCLVIGSLLIQEEEHYFNRLIAAFPNGDLLHYDKRHLFSFAGEDKVFKAGHKRLIFQYKGFRVCPLICYDLRFPVWSRNTQNFDLLVFIANWPNARMLAWDALLRARAIENLCYVAGVNRIGVDNNQLTYTGHSSVYNAMGTELLMFESAAIRTVTLQKSHIEHTRDKFRFLEDRDQFTIET